jgi:hypothetical protein
MLKIGTERRRREARPGIPVSFKTAFLMTSEKIEAGDRRDRLKHRSSCSTVEEDFAAATVMDSSALAAIDALRSCDAISKAPRAAGYRGSDFVPWHTAGIRGTATFPSAAKGLAEAPVAQFCMAPVGGAGAQARLKKSRRGRRRLVELVAHATASYFLYCGLPLGFCSSSSSSL